MGGYGILVRIDEHACHDSSIESCHAFERSRLKSLAALVVAENLDDP